MVTGPGSPGAAAGGLGAGATSRRCSGPAQTLTEIWESDRFTVATLSVAVRAIRTLVAPAGCPTDRGELGMRRGCRAGTCQRSLHRPVSNCPRFA